MFPPLLSTRLTRKQTNEEVDGNITIGYENTVRILRTDLELLDYWLLFGDNLHLHLHSPVSFFCSVHSFIQFTGRKHCV